MACARWVNCPEQLGAFCPSMRVITSSLARSALNMDAMHPATDCAKSAVKVSRNPTVSTPRERKRYRVLTVG